MMNYTKYRPYPTMNMPNRKWPNNVITKAPIWCSVDMLKQALKKLKSVSLPQAIRNLNLQENLLTTILFRMMLRFRFLHRADLILFQKHSRHLKAQKELLYISTTQLQLSREK